VAEAESTLGCTVRTRLRRFPSRGGGDYVCALRHWLELDGIPDISSSTGKPGFHTLTT
jgi:hypothetical protein